MGQRNRSNKSTQTKQLMSDNAKRWNGTKKMQNCKLQCQRTNKKVQSDKQGTAIWVTKPNKLSRINLKLFLFKLLNNLTRIVALLLGIWGLKFRSVFIVITHLQIIMLCSNQKANLLNYRIALCEKKAGPLTWSLHKRLSLNRQFKFPTKRQKISWLNTSLHWALSWYTNRLNSVVEHHRKWMTMRVNPRQHYCNIEYSLTRLYVIDAIKPQISQPFPTRSLPQGN